ncbi:MAG TPA: hypothetical protein PLD55_04470 [bacterium]|nr:hypothetical protein [bacterium]
MITIHTPLESREYGVYNNAGTWTQAGGANFATHFAILDELATVAGSYSGTVYGDGEEIYAPDCMSVFDVTFTPAEEGFFSDSVKTENGIEKVEGRAWNPEFDFAKDTEKKIIRWYK